MARRKHFQGDLDRDVTVVAELTVSSSEGGEIIRGFDQAWHRGLELPLPVRVKWNRFVRKD